jgi:hypothetical protein
MRSGSATPDASITSASARCARRIAVSKAATRSPPIEQQMHPLDSASVSPSRAAISAASIGVSPKSLTMTTRRRPSAWRSRWLTRVVFPAPR